MKMYPGYAALLAVGSILAASAEQPTVTVKPVAVVVALSSPQTSSHGIVALEFSAPDGMYLTFPERTWIRCDRESGYYALFQSDREGVPAEVFDTSPCYGKSIVCCYNVPLSGLDSETGRRQIDDVLPMLVMPELQDSPSVPLDLKEGASVQSGESTIRVVRALRNHGSDILPYSFDLEITGRHPVAELVFRNVDTPSYVSFRKMPYSGTFEETKEGTKQLCHVDLDRQTVEKSKGRVNVALRIAPEKGKVVNVPVKVNFDMQGMISARNEADSSATLVRVNATLAQFESDPNRLPLSVYSEGLALDFCASLPDGYQTASLLSCALPDSSTFSLTPSSGKQPIRVSLRAWPGGDGKTVRCFAYAADIRPDDNFAYQGEFCVPIASGKEDSAVKEIDVRKGANVQIGNYTIEVDNIIQPSGDSNKEGEVSLKVRGGVDIAGLKARAKEGSMPYVYCSGGSGDPDHMENSHVYFRVILPAIPEKLDLSIETWKDMQIHKVPVKGKVSLKVNQ